MDLGLRDTAVLVAAASDGIGKAVALEFAREGAKVVICARNAARLTAAGEEIARATGNPVTAIPADLTKPDAIADLVARARAAVGPIAVLVNNAGGPPPGSFTSHDDAAWAQAVELVLMSCVRLTRAVLPDMQKARSGRIITISSYGVKQPIPDLMLSNSTRLAVIGWSKSLANELAPDNILVNAVCPGWTKTARVSGLMARTAAAKGGTAADAESALAKSIPLGRLASPDEVAAMVVFLASQRASYVTGTAIAVDGGIVQGPL